MKKVFSLGKTPGCIRDISYNERTNRAALVSIPGCISYCLFDCLNFTLLKKAEWPLIHMQVVNSHDFDPEGRIIATVDLNGDCILTDVNSNNYLCQLKFPTQEDEANTICRWNPITPVFALSFDNNKFNLVDSEKQQAMKTKSLRLCDDVINGIDWRKDGNVLISCTAGGEMKLVDTRLKKTIKKFEEFDCEIEAVKWSPDGESVACSTWKGEVKIYDFASEKLIDEVKTPSGIAKSICFLQD